MAVAVAVAVAVVAVVAAVAVAAVVVVAVVAILLQTHLLACLLRPSPCSPSLSLRPTLEPGEPPWTASPADK